MTCAIEHKNAFLVAAKPFNPSTIGEHSDLRDEEPSADELLLRVRSLRDTMSCQPHAEREPDKGR